MSPRPPHSEANHPSYHRYGSKPYFNHPRYSFHPTFYRRHRVMGAFFAAVAGGFVGYWIAKDRYAHGSTHGTGSGHCFGGSWAQRHRERISQPVMNEKPLMDSKVSTGDDITADFAAFQAWKEQQQQDRRQQVNRSAFQTDFKTAAMENADRALDSVLAQVQSLKARLAEHHPVSVAPSSPATEAGNYKLV